MKTKTRTIMRGTTEPNKLRVYAEFLSGLVIFAFGIIFIIFFIDDVIKYGNWSILESIFMIGFLATMITGGELLMTRYSKTRFTKYTRKTWIEVKK